MNKQTGTELDIDTALQYLHTLATLKDQSKGEHQEYNGRRLNRIICRRLLGIIHPNEEPLLSFSFTDGWIISSLIGNREWVARCSPLWSEDFAKAIYPHFYDERFYLDLDKREEARLLDREKQAVATVPQLIDALLLIQEHSTYPLMDRLCRTITGEISPKYRFDLYSLDQYGLYGIPESTRVYLMPDSPLWGHSSLAKGVISHLAIKRGPEDKGVYYRVHKSEEEARVFREQFERYLMDLVDFATAQK